MTPSPDDTALYAEIDRRVRQRLVGVWLALAVAALLSLGVWFSVPMMHGGHPTAATGRIVAVEKDATGETWMTSEFTDGEGVVHRDRETQGYHYAPGEPRVGQRIEYFYERSALTGDLQAYPRADRLLQLVFGVPMALLLALAAMVAWFIVRERATRRWLVRHGRREVAQGASIRQRNTFLPASRGLQSIAMWRLQASYFEPTRSQFVQCNGDWHNGFAPPLREGTALPPILVDPARPSRCWLPTGSLAVP